MEDNFKLDKPVHKTVCLECGMECFYQPPTTAEERMLWHERVVHAGPCEACKGVGWLLMDNSDHGLRIERCDACELFMSDVEAVTYVANALLAVEKAVANKQGG